MRPQWKVGVWCGSMLFACVATFVPAAMAQQFVATFSILGDLVAQVGGEGLQLHTLVGPQDDVHTFEPTPADSIRLHQATLVFEIGLGFETWLDKLYGAAQSRARRVVVSTGLKLLHGENESHVPPPGTSTHAHAHAHAAEDVDPHVWFDVQQVVQMVATIGEALSQYNPSQADSYRRNAAQYSATLGELDAWIVQQVQTIPAARRQLVTSHDNLRYFARRYGFEVIGAAINARSTDVTDVAARDIAALVTRIKTLGVPAIFAETMHPPRLVQRLATEAGVRLAPPLYTDALGPPGGAESTYVTMMRYNVTTIVTALTP